MIDRSYLLKYLQPQDRILLYGKGRNVQLNYEYLIGQSQFQLAGIITPDADQVIDPTIPMYYPEQLRALPPSSYDKVIITVRDQEQGLRMYRAILESGVGKEKIVAAHIYVGPTTGLSLEEFMGDDFQTQLEIKGFIEQQYGNLYYFDPLIKELSKEVDSGDAPHRQFKERADRLPPVERIVFLYILYLAGLFDAELMKSLVTSALQIDDPELLHFLHGIYMDEISMTFFHDEYLFPEYYTLRRSYTEKLCKMYDFHIPVDMIRASKGGRIRKILILNDKLKNHKHAPTQTSIHLSGILAELGYKVVVMPLDLDSNISWKFPVLCPISTLTYYGSREFEDYHRKAYHPNVTIDYIDEIDPKEKMQRELEEIAAFSPDLIIDRGAETSIISYIYGQLFPTLCLPTSGCQSSSYFTYFGVENWDMFMTANEVFHSVACGKEIAWPPFGIIPRVQAKYERGKYLQIPLNQDDFVLISVGNRIGAELTEDFVDVVCERLLSKENIKWLIVGGRNEYLSRRYRELLETRKIVYIPYEDDLAALYQICDVFISPRRRGGGTSVFWAMYYGLPIAQVFSPQADAIMIVGVENAAGETYEQMTDYILSLWENPQKYAEVSTRTRERARHFEAVQKQAWKDFLDELEVRQRKNIVYK